MEKAKFIIEIMGEDLSACTIDGDEITSSNEHWDDWQDCCASGDVQDACEYMISHVGIEFRCIGYDANGNVENRLATDADLQTICETIYFESETDFSDRDDAELYVVWQAASDIIENQRESE